MTTQISKDIQSQIVKDLDYLCRIIEDADRRHNNAVDAGRALAQAVQDFSDGKIKKARLYAVLSGFLARDAGNFNS